jgi:LysR family transcriptional regulator, glycine cleavage system transcriptional activator
MKWLNESDVSQRRPSLYSLQVFDTVARFMSFTRAAADLGVTQGAVSYQIRLLEEQLRTTLFARQGRSIVLTRAGEQLSPTLRRALGEIQAATAAVSRAADRTLTVSLTTYFASRWLLPRLAGFMRGHHDVEVRLVHTATANAIQPSDADVAIRWGRGEWRGVSAELLFPCELTPVCATTLTRGPKRIRKLSDLRDHAVLDDDEMRVPWTEWLAAAGIEYPGSIGLVILDANVRIQLAIDGQGFALADQLVAADIAQGRLAAPFDVLLEGYGYYLVGVGGATKPIARAFCDWLKLESAKGHGHEGWTKAPRSRRRTARH